MRAVSSLVLPGPSRTAGRSIVGGAVLQLSGRILGLGCTLVTIHVAASYLGVRLFGEFSLVTDMAALLVIVAEIGVSAVLAREIGRAPERTDAVASMLLGFRLTASVAVVALAMAVIPLAPYPSPVKHAMLIAFVGSLAGSIATFPAAIFQVNFRFDLIAASDLVARLAFLLLVGLAVTLHASLTIFAVPFLVANVTQLVFSFTRSRAFWRLGVSLDWARSRALIRDAILIGLVSLIGLLHFKGDVILMSLLRSSHDVGIYSVAYRAIEQVFFLPLMLTGILFPVLTRLVHGRTEAGHRLVGGLVAAFVGLAVPVNIVLFLLSRSVVSVLATSSFEQSRVPLMILSFSIPFVFGGTVLTTLLVITNSTRRLLLIPSLALVVNVLSNLYFITHYGVVGAAATTVITEALCFAGLLWSARESYPFPISALAVTRLLAAAAAAWTAVGLTAGEPSLARAGVGVTVWAGAVVGSRCIRRSDLRDAVLVIDQVAAADGAP